MVKRNNQDFALPGATCRCSPPAVAEADGPRALGGVVADVTDHDGGEFRHPYPQGVILSAKPFLPPFLPPSEGAIGCVGLRRV